MAELVLTAERRAELAGLLGDDQRLRTEYPKVAEYLDAAPMLPGTSDERADAAFDLRVVHYMTGDRSISANPYWDIVAPSVSERDGRRTVDGGRPRGSARLGFAQTVLQAAYAYAIPAPETIAWLAAFSYGRRVVELGAGRGYWAAQLADAGVRVEAYDSEPPDSTENASFPCVAGQQAVWHSVRGVGEYSAREAAESDVLLLIWPPGWGNPMASEALATFEAGGGNRLVYIGEPQGGKTGDDAFFDALAASWHLESEDPHYVSWWNLPDRAQAWVRR
ncbi:hypothetical protein BJY24_000913 [Nocardia transvalensis]|uniref:Class I SAM-dependent methyltransferase n=1 Tax=Nocardia transvalensis TaxID=37333 RepID=A0A7W9UGF8_9NOCA|nr:hypothetical protein [Nocardia transvalensis]MBB5912046.1 hypothetical protein [Nocardia transvalensis]